MFEILNGTRILLVEDNHINQKVAKEIMEAYGLIVDVAENGEEAIEAVTKTPYDVVLMDVQMPVMDGFRASKKIREKNINIPIIAMTAHALRSDQEKCMAAGMNDYIAKPLDIDQLLAAIAKWIRKNNKSVIINDVSSGASNFSFGKPVPGIDIDKAEKELRGNIVLFKNILNEFIKLYSTAGADIRKAIQNNERELAARTSHTLKGVSGIISADALYLAARDLEQAIKTNQDEESIEELISRFDTALNEAVASAQTIIPRFDNIGKADNQAQDKESRILNIAQLLSQLAELLNKNNPKAEQILCSMKPYPPDTESAFKRLEDQLSRYDFKGARKTLTEIAGMKTIGA